MIRISSFFLFLTYSLLSWTQQSFASDSLDPVLFREQSFATCDALEDTVLSLVKKSKNHYWYPYMYARGGIALDMAQEGTAVSEKSALPTGASDTSVPHSLTNIQVAGVDEGDTLKTDGKYIYTYVDTLARVRIVHADTLELQKEITLPTSMSQIELYLNSGKLIILGSQYISPSETESRYVWYPMQNKTTVLVYNVQDPKNPLYESSYQIDGTYRESRMIGSRLYFLSENSLNIPYIYSTQYGMKENGFDLAIKDMERDFVLENFAPKIRESSLSKSSKNGFIQSVRSSVARCSDVKLLIPDEKIMDTVDFFPSFVSLSSFDVSKVRDPLKNRLIFGNISQIHMSEKSLYILSSISRQVKTSTGLLCPPNAKCTSPILPPSETITNTLIHRYSLNAGNPRYIYSTSVPGNPLSQYSIDEDSKTGNLRIVTSEYAWQSTSGVNSTRLSIVSSSGKILGGLSNIAPKENFQSARFIRNRLYLVTFEQIDPLFVIDLSTPTAPKILGELKIPGYSTYLHPYDENRLIGVGYDTITNQWGGTQNGGIKIDLYNVTDVKNPQRQSTLTLGTAGSSADVLSNPRLFTWYKEKNLLLLPATIMSGYQDTSKQVVTTSAFQGVVGISITPTGISEKFRVTHIARDKNLESDWKKSCDDTFKTLKEPVCRKLLNGKIYCETNYQYVPPYCYMGSTVDSYFAQNLWNYSDTFIRRAAYIGDTYYTLSDTRISSWRLARPTYPVNSLLLRSSPDTKILPIPLGVAK